MRELPTLLQRGLQAMSPPSPRRALEARLQAQEFAALGNADGPLTEAHSADGLVAARRYHEAQAGQVVDQLLTGFRAALPEAPGPLNPEALVIRALTRAQAVSPAYVERLMRHAEVLCALQRVTAAEPANSRPARTRRRKPVKA
ncbi:DUF2894 domain-containing protein [Haliea sp.]|uniref:DUF2894 domain-containing protein n=1 Tax=Haliea sp. TaxID=1932666 RepID=UPI0035297163